MSELQEPVSIECSNGWFFAVLASIIVPWIVLPDRLELWGLGAALLFWAFLVSVWMRREHVRFVAWLGSQDESILHAMAANYRIGSIRQRAVSNELARRAGTFTSTSSIQGSP